MLQNTALRVYRPWPKPWKLQRSSADTEPRRGSWESGETGRLEFVGQSSREGKPHTEDSPQIFSRELSVNACEVNAQSRGKKLVQLGRIKLGSHRDGYSVPNEEPDRKTSYFMGHWVCAQEGLVS